MATNCLRSSNEKRQVDLTLFVLWDSPVRLRSRILHDEGYIASSPPMDDVRGHDADHVGLVGDIGGAGVG